MTQKRSVSLAGHRTSVALEPEFWTAVERLAEARGLSVAAFITDVDRGRGVRNLASALRVAVLLALKAEAATGSGTGSDASPTVAARDKPDPRC